MSIPRRPARTCWPPAVGALLPALQRQQLLQRIAGLLRGALSGVLCRRRWIIQGEEGQVEATAGRWVCFVPQPQARLAASTAGRKQPGGQYTASQGAALPAATNEQPPNSPEPAVASIGGCAKQHSARSVSRRSGWLAADRLGASSGASSCSCAVLSSAPAAAACCSTAAAAATAW